MCLGLADYFSDLLNQNSLKLILNVKGLLKRSKIEEILVAPICVHPIIHESLVCLEQCQMVAVIVLELLLSRVSLVPRISRPHEDIRHIKHGNNCQSLLSTLISLCRCDYTFGKHWIQGELRHLGATICQVSLIIECTNIMQVLQGTH